MYLPLLFLLASLVSGCFSYFRTRQSIADDLNDGIVALAKAKGELWTRQDTLDALSHIHELTGEPLLFRATDVDFKIASLRDQAYYSLALVDNGCEPAAARHHGIASDSVLLMMEDDAAGLAVKVQGFADCSMASVLAVSDPTVPGALLILSLASMAAMCLWGRRGPTEAPEPVCIAPVAPSLDGVKLTPMQKRLAQMLLDAPGRRVDKASLCSALWGNKSNAEESLYTLVRRTKAALSETGMEITCNRGDSYELHITD